MKVKRIVANVAAVNLDDATLFYESIFDLTLEMDHGWIKTYSSGEKMTTQDQCGIGRWFWYTCPRFIDRS